MQNHKKVSENKNILTRAIITTPLGDMIALVNDHALVLLEFADCFKLEREIKKLKTSTQSTIVSGTTALTTLLTQELNHYFTGTLQTFTTPLHFFGSSFQQRVWQALQQVPYGATTSYATLANAIEKPSAYRAVAQGNATNRLAIIIPCHRVINKNAQLGGYAGGLSRKEFLINHEKSNNK